MSDLMIRVENLTKDYGPVRAVDRVTFNVRKGEVLGFLGPNGAGKSTTMKMLTCYIAPTAGVATVAGHDVYDDSLEVRKHLGYLPEDTPLYRDMTVHEYLEFAAEMRQMEPHKRGSRIKEIGGRCGLSTVAGKLVGELSKGYRQRLGLAQAMLHDPDILVLDEPTSGLDPNQIVEIRQLIKELGQEKTVILSTHILPEVQATCSRILIISGGKLVADDTPEALRAREKGSRYRVMIESNGTSADAIRDKLASVAGVARCEKSASETGALAFTLDGRGDVDLRRSIFRAVVDNHWPLLELVRESVSLEDVFRNLTTSDVVGKAAAAAVETRREEARP
jgi:ABC-2 type transport system ATP-binding protein